MSTTYKNGEDVSRDYRDECPEHGTPIRKEYTFGRRDSTVITFSGCKCACHLNGWNELTYFTSYEQAAGAASLNKAMMRQ